MSIMSESVDAIFASRSPSALVEKDRDRKASEAQQQPKDDNQKTDREEYAVNQ